ncbi:MAG: glycosyltransferase family 9 protein [Bacteroidales bacterium]|jgi:ADP-heptose:LPS heptosyltransferase|nr:glycosyltransferase family 9 protein [Bacteroidales bacterium]
MRILIIRTSAMGDVALTTPVLRGMLDRYPETEIILLTRPQFWAYFGSYEKIQLFLADFRKSHKGISGLFRLYRDIQKQGTVDYVIDLHDVLRSKILRSFFRLKGVPAVKIDKGRKEKKAIIKGISREPIRHTVDRYADVMRKAGFDFNLPSGPWIIPGEDSIRSISGMIDPNGEINIGIAPFAKHKLKMWPVENMISLMKKLSEHYRAKFWLFGGKDEQGKLDVIHEKIRNSENLAGRLNLGEEIAFMSVLDVMISMDSSNMHMSALTGTNVISIWGATDPVTGFGAWGQPDEYSVRIPYSRLNCRPCTVFGKGSCRRKDHACMNWLTPEIVFQQITDSGLFDRLLAAKNNSSLRKTK